MPCVFVAYVDAHIRLSLFMRVAKCPTYLLNIIKYLVLFFFWVILLFIVDKFLLVARKDSKKETPSTSMVNFLSARSRVQRSRFIGSDFTESSFYCFCLLSRLLLISSSLLFSLLSGFSFRPGPTNI